MTKENAKGLLPLVEALARGETIQMRTQDEWHDLSGEIVFSFPPGDYRIKPAPKLRPWRADEVPVGALYRDVGTGNRHLITGISSTGRVHIANPLYECEAVNGYALDSLLKGEYSTDGGKTWKPCGVEE